MIKGSVSHFRDSVAEIWPARGEVLGGRSLLCALGIVSIFWSATGVQNESITMNHNELQ